MLNALSIRHVGARVANVLAHHFGSLEKLQAATHEELSEVNEIGPTIAESVFEFLHSEDGEATIAGLRDVGVLLEVVGGRAAGGALEGKTFVVTGTLHSFSRDQIHKLIEQEQTAKDSQLASAAIA